MHGLEQKYSGKIDFVYLDSDDEAVDPWKVDLGYAGFPSFVLVDGDGKIVKSWAGPVSAESFEKAFEVVLVGE